MNISRTCFLGLALIAAVSCNDEPLGPQTAEEQGREAMVRLSISALPDSDGMPGSRAVGETVNEGTGSDYKVTDFWLLEYNNNGLLIGSPHYYLMSEFTETDDVAVPVILPENGEEYQCVVIANTHSEAFSVTLGTATTLDKLRSVSMAVRDQSYMYNKTTGDLLMNCIVPVRANTTVLDCQLYRNVAKLTLTLENAHESGVRIRSVQLRNVTDRIFYADRLYTDAEAPSPTEDEAGFCDWEVEDCDVAAGDSKELFFYLPRNMRGESAATEPGQKNVEPPLLATYLEIMAEDTSRDTPLRYRFYLGQNMTNNFNIIPNHHYKLPIAIDGIDEVSMDNRVEDLGTVQLPESNSYLINPLSGDAQTRYWVPITRINKFWVEEGEDKTMPITPETDWVAEVIWQDRPGPLIDFCKKDGSVVAGTDYKGTGESFFYFRPRKGASGNVVIGVRLSTSALKEYLWSWHLWITDYNPDYTATWEEGVYNYPVIGGEVHRYAGNADKSNIWDRQYLNKYIMDRNLGAMSATAFEASRGLYYQFGRKDPFPYWNTTLYGMDGQPQQFFTSTGNDCIQRDTGPVPVYGGVQKPYVFYSGGSDWVSGNKNIGSLWNNPSWYRPETGKSLFDPCPPGWKMPERSVWANFGFWGTAVNGKEFSSGWYFYLSDAEAGVTAWYPACGARNALGVGNHGTHGYYWTATPRSAIKGTYMQFYGTVANSDTDIERTMGAPVRCVQE